MKLSLQAARVNAGLSQKDVADSLKISSATLRNWESGRTFPDVCAAKKLCELYGVDMDTIFFTD